MQNQPDSTNFAVFSVIYTWWRALLACMEKKGRQLCGEGWRNIFRGEDNTRTMGSPNTENGAKRAMDHGVRTDAKMEISLTNGSYGFLANSYRWVEFWTRQQVCPVSISLYFFNTVMCKSSQIKANTTHTHISWQHQQIPLQFKQRKTNIHCQRQLCVVIPNYSPSLKLEGSQFMRARIPCDGWFPVLQYKRKPFWNYKIVKM